METVIIDMIVDEKPIPVSYIKGQRLDVALSRACKKRALETQLNETQDEIDEAKEERKKIKAERSTLKTQENEKRLARLEEFRSKLLTEKLYIIDSIKAIDPNYVDGSIYNMVFYTDDCQELKGSASLTNETIQQSRSIHACQKCKLIFSWWESCGWPY